MTDIGDDVTITTTITVDGTLTDPATVTVAVTDPAGAVVAPAPTPTHPSTGVYEATVAATSSGRWRYVWTTTGPDGVDHGHFDVQPNPPRLEPLASLSDLEDRVGPLSEAQATRAEALLRDASAQVRRFCRQDFDLVEGDTIVVRPVGADLILPQRPVIAVSSVAAIRGDGEPDITMTGWTWDGLDRIRIGGIGWRTAINLDLELDWIGWSPDTYKVTNDHGYTTTPDDVVGIVCGMVNRVVLAPSMVEGMLSERAGPFGYTLQQGAAGAPGPQVRLTKDDQQALVDAGYRRTAGTIQLRA